MTEAANGLLRVEGLTVDFDGGKPTAHRALDGVSLSIAKGEILAMVGESGSGKTVFARTLIGVLPDRAEVRHCEFLWNNEDMSAFSETRRREWCRKSIAVIWQNPQGSLVPVYSVGKQMHWLLKLQGENDRSTRQKLLLDLFERVGLRQPERIACQLPENLSGGECQRVMVAMALSRNPELLIADEPTSNLDVKLQSEIISLIKSIAAEFNFAMLFITHNLVIASHLANRTVILYRGKIVEEGPTNQVLQNPRSAYTQSLVASATLQPALH